LAQQQLRLLSAQPTPSNFVAWSLSNCAQAAQGLVLEGEHKPLHTLLSNTFMHRQANTCGIRPAAAANKKQAHWVHDTRALRGWQVRVQYNPACLLAVRASVRHVWYCGTRACSASCQVVTGGGCELVHFFSALVWPLVARTTPALDFSLWHVPCSYNRTQCRITHPVFGSFTACCVTQPVIVQ
jgi:hypothetical protein